MATTPATPNNEQNFEDAIARLEKIVAEMDSPTLPLEQLVVHYEEGVKLVKVCEDKLKDAERKIEIITRKAPGRPELSTFEPDANDATAKPSAVSRKDINLF